MASGFKAVILAGGLGTRLRPLTHVLPKPLVPVGERPIIDIIMRQLRTHGVREVVLSVGYLAELIQAYFHHVSIDGLNVTYVKENEPLGTAGSLALIPGLDDTFMAMNGDILTTLDYAGMVEAHRRSGAALTIAMHRKRIKVDLGVLETDESGRVRGYIEKPVQVFPVSMGIYVYEPRTLGFITPGERLDFPDLVLRLIAAGEKVMAYDNEAFWLDIGRAEDYAQAHEAFERMKADILPDVRPGQVA